MMGVKQLLVPVPSADPAKHYFAPDKLRDVEPATYVDAEGITRPTLRPLPEDELQAHLIQANMGMCVCVCVCVCVM